MKQECKQTQQQAQPNGTDRKVRIYVCSPLRPKADAEKQPERAKKEFEENLDRARTACRLVMNLGAVPLCSHLFCTAFLDDGIPSERRQGMELGLEMLKDADELWCFSERISEGMAAEIAEASKLGIPVRMLCESSGLLGGLIDALMNRPEATDTKETTGITGTRGSNENYEKDYDE